MGEFARKYRRLHADKSVQKSFYLRQAIFSWPLNTWRVLDGNGHTRYSVKQQPFRLKEEYILVDAQNNKIILSANADRVLETSVTYRFIDPKERVVLRAKYNFAKSLFLRTEWDLLTAADQKFNLTETDTQKAIFRRMNPIIAIFRNLQYDLVSSNKKTHGQTSSTTLFGYKRATVHIMTEAKVTEAQQVLLAAINASRD